MSWKQKLLSFKAIVLIGSIIGAILVATGPLLKEQYARFAWTQVPCRVLPAGGFLFKSPGDDKVYICGRENMWNAVKNTDAALASAGTEVAVANSTCYVNGSQGRPTAVHFLNAYQRLDQGILHFIGGGLILASGIGVVIASSRRAKQKSASDPDATA